MTDRTHDGRTHDDDDTHDHDDDHPAIDRLHTEFAAARHGLAQIGAVADDAHRERIVAAIRTELPDVASRSAHEAGGEAVLAEIRWFERLDLGVGAPRAAELWTAILADATEAVRASD